MGLIALARGFADGSLNSCSEKGDFSVFILSETPPLAPNTTSPQLGMVEYMLQTQDLSKRVSGLPTEITSEELRVIEYYRFALSSGGNAWNSEVLPAKLRSSKQATSMAVCNMMTRNALAHVHCMYALKAFISIRMRVISNMRTSSERDALFHMCQAISAIRKVLLETQKAHKVVEWFTILSIHQLTMANWYSGDLEAARAHIGAVASLEMQLSPEEPWQGFMMESMRTADIQVAIELGTTPHIPAKSPDKASFSTRLREMQAYLRQEAAGISDHQDVQALHSPEQSRFHQENVLADAAVTMNLKLGLGLHVACKCNVLDGGMRSIILDFVDCLTIAKFVWRTSLAQKEDAAYMCTLARFLEHKLATYTPLPRVSDVVRHLSECVRLALLIMLTCARNRMSRRALPRVGSDLVGALNRLQECWPHLDRDSLILDDCYPRNLLLWLYATAAFALHDCSEEIYLCGCAATLASMSPSCGDYGSLHQVMSRFVYSSTTQKHTLLKISAACDMH